MWRTLIRSWDGHEDWSMSSGADANVPLEPLQPVPCESPRYFWAVRAMLTNSGSLGRVVAFEDGLPLRPSDLFSQASSQASPKRNSLWLSGSRGHIVLYW
ncbi:hypothetical protein N7478_000661 [Penicillium angulare]|uniref:uncharacterized protein n=1 Tax=Penicillium angulare TaxID=116970 RepID=UPI002540631D|nr:uncharacterized protein N7478_000661 [Penicillium angulare]KAJ5291410.1 hypothetical protein N7478_000661 [Penicillium angulare]